LGATAETAYQYLRLLIEVYVNLTCLAPSVKLELAFPPVNFLAYRIATIAFLASFPAI
jgi:hypothetical protein